MTIDQARTQAGLRWCVGNHNRPCAWIASSGLRAIGFTDGEFRYAMGIGATWEEALTSAQARTGCAEQTPEISEG